MDATQLALLWVSRRSAFRRPCPEDFDAFWQGKLAAQAKALINSVLTPVPTDLPGVQLSIFALDAFGSKAHGYIARPTRGGKFPAPMQLQYAGVYALNAEAVGCTPPRMTEADGKAGGGRDSIRSSYMERSTPLTTAPTFLM